MRPSEPPFVPPALLDRLGRLFPASGEEVGKDVRILSETFVQGGKTAEAGLSSEKRRAAYARYYLPVNYAKLRLILDELALDEAAGLGKKPSLRILDLGCGPGTFLLASIGYFADGGRVLRELDLTGLDSNEGFLRTAESLLGGFAEETLPGTKVRISLFRRDLTEPLPAEAGTGFDLVVAGNALSEGFADPVKAAAWLATLGNHLRPQGALVVIEPALKRTSRFLHQARDALLAMPERRLHVFAPCLHEGPCPALGKPGDWCHERIPWNPPQALGRIDRAAGLDKDTLTFSYLVLRSSPRSLKDAFRVPGKDLHRGRVVSDALPEKGKEGRVVCTEEGRWVHYEALQRGKARTAQKLAALGRGEVALFPAGRPAGFRTRLSPGETPERLEAPFGDE